MQMTEGGRYTWPWYHLQSRLLRWDENIYKISDTYNSCSWHIMCQFGGLFAVKMDAVSRGMHLLPAGYFATSTRCGSGADHPWTGSWTRIPPEDQSQRLILKPSTSGKRPESDRSLQNPSGGQRAVWHREERQNTTGHKSQLSYL